MRKKQAGYLIAFILMVLVNYPLLSIIDGTDGQLAKLFIYLFTVWLTGIILLVLLSRAKMKSDQQ